MRSTFLCLFALGFSALAPVSSAFADGAAVDVATAEQKLSAQKHFETAIKSFQENKLDAALTEFTASYGVVASPNAHYMMAKCMDGLGKPADAYNALSSIEKEARGLDKYNETLKNSGELKNEVAKKVGIVVVNVTGQPSGTVTATVGHTTVPVGTQYAVMPGKVEVAALVDGKVVKNDGAAVNAGETHPFNFDLTPAPIVPAKAPGSGLPQAGSEPISSGSGGRTGFYVGGGVSAAVAVAGFGVAIPFGIMYQNNKHHFTHDLCNDGTSCKATQAQLDSLGSTIQKDGNIATAGFVVGGVAAGLSVTLFAVGATRPKGGSTSDQSSVKLDVGPTSIGVDGTF